MPVSDEHKILVNSIARLAGKINRLTEEMQAQCRIVKVDPQHPIHVAQAGESIAGRAALISLEAKALINRARELNPTLF